MPVYALDVPPAATVYAGILEAFGPMPDAVASGVNPGLNYGPRVLHSGTVGAALTAAVVGSPGVAVSIAWAEHPHWATAAGLVPAALEWAVAQSGPPPVVNLSVPDVEPADLLGVRPAHLAPFLEQWPAAHTPGEVLLDYVGRRADPPAGSDLATVLEGYAAVTLLRGVASAPATDAAAAIDAVRRDYAVRS